MTGDCLRVALVEAEQIAADGSVEIGGLDVIRQIRFFRTRRTTVDRTATAGACALAAATAILRRITACGPLGTVRVTATVASVEPTTLTGITAFARPSAFLGITTAREAGVVAPPTGTAAVGRITATGGPTTLSRGAATGIAPVP
ncbi:hypothetical protein AB4305_20565 [Nocardia sp. 2YAB30]